MTARNRQPPIQTGLLGRATDYAVQIVAPQRAARRRAARMALGDGFDVTRTSRRRRRQSFRGGPADTHQDTHTLFHLRELCRAGDRQSPLLHGILDRAVENILGPTFEWQPMTADEGWNRAAHAYTNLRAGPSADIRRMMDLRALAQIWLRSCFTDGDTLVGFTDDGLVTYEADQLVSPGKGQAGEKAIINGIEVNRRTGRPVAYHVADRKWRGLYSGASWARDTHRIPAAEALLIGSYQRTSQTRAVPALAPALATWDHLDGYLESEQIAAQVASHVVYMIQRANPAFFVDPGTGALYDWVYDGVSDADGDTSRQFEKSEPGMILQGLLGDELKVIQADRPGRTFEPYLRVIIRLIGASVGMPLELVLLDLSQTNYSSARAALLQAYRTFRCWQHLVVRTALQPWYERDIGQGIVDGALTLRDDAFNVRWFMPRWGWIDPYKEVLAKERAVAAGFDCLTDTIEEERQTLETFVQRRQHELDALRTAGIPTTTAPDNLTRRTDDAREEAG